MSLNQIIKYRIQTFLQMYLIRLLEPAISNTINTLPSHNRILSLCGTDNVFNTPEIGSFLRHV